MADPEVRKRIATRRAELDGQQAAGPVMTRQVGEAIGLDTGVRGALEPLRGRLTKPADRARLRKLPEGKFTARL
ncbi:hypothetical protein [Streptomyces sp. NPDC097610]|uniref:hypothetical protein n=1 Tax=Streptomyces sp. NPDC097610 TaxID=3157227 RepID=UPI00332D7355